jgi:hypothetical protein
MDKRGRGHIFFLLFVILLVAGFIYGMAKGNIKFEPGFHVCYGSTEDVLRCKVMETEDAASCLESLPDEQKDPCAVNCIGKCAE